MGKWIVKAFEPDPPKNISEWIREYRIMDDALADIIMSCRTCIEKMFKMGKLELHYDLYRILGHASFLRRVIQNRIEGLKHQLENKEVFEECLAKIPERKYR